MVGNIFCDNRASANKTVSSESRSADKRGISANSGAFFDKSGSDLIHFSYYGRKPIQVSKIMMIFFLDINSPLSLSLIW